MRCIFRACRNPGRYLYVIGRDARINLIDLWMETPLSVAEIKVGLEARSVETSKFKGYRRQVCDCRDLLAAAVRHHGRRHPEAAAHRIDPRHGGRHPEEYHPEPRVASIVSSHYNPEFLVNAKETGKILVVNYKDLTNLRITTINAAQFLHDGGMGFDRALLHGRGQCLEQDRRGRHQGPTS
jgi:nitrite reductase (NO-forming)/hydroxylamine reductase